MRTGEGYLAEVLRIPRVSSLGAEETVRFTTGVDFVLYCRPEIRGLRLSSIPSASSCTDHSSGRSIPSEQGLGIKISGLTSLVDRFDDSGRRKGKPRETLDIAR